MMRTGFFLLNLVLFSVAAGLLAANWKFRNSPDDELLEWHVSDAAETGNLQKEGREVPQTALIRSKNIFSPLRGSEPAAANGGPERKSAPPRFELVGICSIGDASGAIINVQGAVDSKERKKRYFVIGEDVNGGFILDSVAENTIVLKRQNETLELKIDRSRFGAEVGKNRGVQPSGAAPGSVVRQVPGAVSPGPGGTPIAPPVRHGENPPLSGVKAK